MNEIEIFKNNEFGEIRTTLIDNEPWFVGKNVALALGYKDTDAAIRTHVDNDDKQTRQFIGAGQKRDMVIINESGLYSLIMSSKLETAKKFKRWVTSEVLPAIRKMGAYSLPDSKTVSNSFSDRVQANTTWIEWQKKMFNLSDSATLALCKQFATPLGLPTVDYLTSKGTLHSATELLKKNNINLSARGFNQLAVTNGILRELERKSHKGIKEYKNLTEKGLAYGENQVNPQNPKETQPMYYDDKFVELCQILGIEPINE